MRVRTELGNDGTGGDSWAPVRLTWGGEEEGGAGTAWPTRGEVCGGGLVTWRGGRFTAWGGGELDVLRRRGGWGALSAESRTLSAHEGFGGGGGEPRAGSVRVAPEGVPTGSPWCGWVGECGSVGAWFSRGEASPETEAEERVMTTIVS